MGWQSWVTRILYEPAKEQGLYALGTGKPRQGSKHKKMVIFPLWNFLWNVRKTGSWRPRQEANEGTFSVASTRDEWGTKMGCSNKRSGNKEKKGKRGSFGEGRRRNYLGWPVMWLATNERRGNILGGNVTDSTLKGDIPKMVWCTGRIMRRWDSFAHKRVIDCE